MDSIISKLQQKLQFVTFPRVTITDIVEILILTFCIYEIIIWVKKTRAWTLVKGLIIIFAAYIVAFAFNMHVILWIFDKTLTLGITAIIIIFQPDIRKALEQLGQTQILNNFSILNNDKSKEVKFTDKSREEMIKAAIDLGRAKTGALIVIEKDINLNDYIRTGIDLDSVITSQLLINIFEKNTPLHDGAVIVRNDRVVAATCYLPLTDSQKLSKELGTRHRAALGISEATDSLTIVVSEETGDISVASKGILVRNVDENILRKKLVDFQGTQDNTGGKKKRSFKKRGQKGESGV
ncbi:MAG: diadenylate cyclase CdaA [Lachnospiraceae bacterium]|jgi:diadenylate cyclase|nr:diadenylate cyclase CdaA [Lachnospiraceae bacterium]MEE3461895.1 diadenylate cyclase CdaA [Lachnospiraceae bacterium]